MTTTPAVEAPGALDLEFEAPVEEEAIEAPAEEAAPVAEKPKEVPATAAELVEFRDDKGVLDAGKLKPVLAAAAQAANFQQYMVKLLDGDPELATATLKSMKKSGTQLTQEQEAFLTAQKPAVPVKTEAQINQEYYAILNKDGEAAAQRYFHREVTLPAQQKTVAEYAAAERAKAEAEQAKGRAAQQQTQAVQTLKDEFKAAAEKFKELFKPDANTPYGYQVTDKPVFDMMVSMKKQSAVLTIPELTELALFRLGRLGKSKPANTQIIARAPANAAVKVKPKLRPGEMELEIQR